MLSEQLRPLLTGHRRVRFRWDILDLRSGSRIGTLDGVENGSVEYSIHNEIKGGGSFHYAGTEEINWHDVLIQPWYIAEGSSGSVEWPLGVFLPTTPAQAHTATGTEADIDLYDKTLMLSGDKFAGSFSVPAGAIVTETIRTIITNSVPNAILLLEDSPKTLNVAMVWPADTTVLQVVNDLLDTINYFSLWADTSGVFRSEPYTAPAQRPTQWEFADDEYSIYLPEFLYNADGFSIPNEYILVSSADEEVPALVSRAVNMDPESPYSYPRRGRWISRLDDGVDVTDQETLDATAQRRLEAATSVSETYEMTHAPLELSLNDAVMFVNAQKGISTRAVVQSWSLSTEVGALTNTTLLGVKS